MTKKSWVLIGFSYGLMVCALAVVGTDDIYPFLAGIGCVVCLVGFVWYIICAFRAVFKKEESLILICQCFWTKIMLIPLYILMFIWGVGCIFAPFAIFILPIPIAVDCAVLVTSSSFGVAGILKAYMEEKITKKSMILHIICQFIFCLDLISICMCRKKIKVVS
ncbi:MAG: hypothetical protein ACI4D9_10715 [Lachnospiraceae bacterium]